MSEVELIAKVFSVRSLLTNNTHHDLFPHHPSTAELSGFVFSPPQIVYRGTTGSAGEFKTYPHVHRGISAVIVYDLPDPNYALVFYVSVPINGQNIVKVGFVSTHGLIVDKRLVIRFSNSSAYGSSAIHGFYEGGEWHTFVVNGAIGHGHNVKANFSVTEVDTNKLIAENSAKAIE